MAGDRNKEPDDLIYAVPQSTQSPTPTLPQGGGGADQGDADTADTESTGTAGTGGVTAGLRAGVPVGGAVIDAIAGTARKNADADAEAVMGLDEQIRTIEEMRKRYKEPESDEARRKREKRERARKIVAAVSDGLSALGNVYFTSQYAPDMYDPKHGISTATGKRIEQLKADRDKNDENYYNLNLKLGDLKNKKAQTLRDLAAKKAEEQRAAERHGWAREDRPLEKETKQHNKDAAESKAREAASRANMAAEEEKVKPEKLQAEIDLLGERQETERTKQHANNASANNSNASAGKNRAQAGYYRAQTHKVKNSAEGPYIEVNRHKIYDKDLNDLFVHVDQDIKDRYKQEDQYNERKTPTKEEMRAAIADYVNTYGTLPKGNAYVAKKKKGKNGYR